jgi:cytochrome c oxidase subunit IV
MEATTHTVQAGQHAHPDNTKAIWRTLGILTVITIAELIVGMFIAPDIIKKNPGVRLYFNTFYLICTLAKAFYIVAEFMHLRHEIKNFIMTIVFPLTLFIWFIIAFLWEGDSYKNLRDTHNKKTPVPFKQAPIKEGTPH